MSNLNIICQKLLFLMIFVCFGVFSGIPFVGSIFAPPRPFAPSLERRLRDFIDIRTGGNGRDHVWHYRGVIRNTISGSEVVTVEGIERVRLLDASWRLKLPWTQQPTINSKSSTMRPPSASYISNKAFIYTNASDPTSAVYYNRIRPTSPKRPVMPIRHFVEQVTIGTSPSNNKLISHVSWPGGRILLSRSLDVALDGGALLGVAPRRHAELSHFVRAQCQKNRQDFKGISRWVSFARGTDPNAAHAHEVYSLSKSILQPSARMSCRRQGECPPWYAPGRQCSSEFTAIRYRSLKQLPRSTLLLFNKVAPDVLRSLERPCDDSLWAVSEDPLSHYPTWYSRALDMIR